jgi:hypothetical protein
VAGVAVVAVAGCVTGSRVSLSPLSSPLHPHASIASVRTVANTDRRLVIVFPRDGSARSGSLPAVETAGAERPAPPPCRGGAGRRGDRYL